LLAKDYSVVACARNLSAAKVLDWADRCFIVDGDVGIRATGESLTDLAIAKTGRLDLVFNNAGIFAPGNFHFYVAQPAVRRMRTQGQGPVVTISTTLVNPASCRSKCVWNPLQQGSAKCRDQKLGDQIRNNGHSVQCD
jgi:NADP-dependent 3-hydroxy acid dehydrogenase YdfG